MDVVALEAGQLDPDYDSLLRVARALDVRVSTIFRHAEEETPSQAAERHSRSLPVPSYPSKDFGQTPPPPDGTIVACPACVNGRKRDFCRRACPDCLGSGVQGYGFTALQVFEEWVAGPSVGDEADEGGC